MSGSTLAPLGGGSGSGQLALALGKPRRRVIAPTVPAPVLAASPRPVGGFLDKPIVLASTKAKQAVADFSQQHFSPRSIASQIKDAATGIIPGVLHLAKEGAVEAALPVRNLVDSITGHTDAPENYRPVSTGLLKSFGNTGGDIIHPSRFGKAIKEGRIVDKVLEDAGNIALVGGAASKVLTGAAGLAEGAGAPRLASALETGGRAAERVSTLGNTIADAPISLPRRGITFARDAIRDKLGEVSQSGQFMGADVSRFAPTLSGKFSEEGLLAKPLVKEGERTGQQAEGHIHQQYAQAAKEMGISLDEQAAATALTNGVGHIDAHLQGQLADGIDATTLHQSQARPEQNLTPSAAATTRAYLDGTLDAEAVARIDKAKEFIGGQIDKATARVMDPESGFLSGQLDPRQLGDDPMYAPENLARLTNDTDNITPEHVAEAQKALDEGTVDPAHLKQVMEDPSSYPAAWRPSMVAAAKGRAAGFDVPLLPAEQLAAGFPKPRYIPGGESINVVPRHLRVSSEQLRRGFGGLRGSSAEHQRVSSEVQSYSFRTQAEKFGGQAKVAEQNKALLKFAQSPTVKTVAQTIPQEALDHFKAQAAAEAKVIGGSPSKIATETQRHYGELISRHLKDAFGKEAFLGDKANPQVGDFNPKADINMSQVNENTPVLPIGVKSKITPVSMPKGLSVPTEVLKFINAKFKRAVLPLSLRWQAGDLVGGAFMAAVGGGMPPWELAQHMRELKHLTPEATDALFNNPNFVDSGLRFEGKKFLTEDFMNGQKAPKTIIGRTMDRSMAFNEKINQLNRHGYLLGKVQDVLEKHGLSIDSVDKQGAWATPEVKGAIDVAVDDANRVMGAFDDMSPIEQRVLKNVFPFYVWMRHITQLAYHTAVDNPARMMWTLRLGSFGAQKENLQNLPDWLKGSVGAGGLLAPTNFLNPFNDVSDQVMNPVPTLERALSPGIKLPIIGATGKDPSKGLADISRPFGEKRSPVSDMLYAGLQTFPITRTAMQVAPTSTAPKWLPGVGGLGFGPHPRYRSGQFMVDKNTGDPLASNTPSPRLASAAGLIGIPWPSSTDLVDQLAKSKDKSAKLQRRKRKHVRVAG